MVDVLLAAIALVGHTALALACFNRLHAVGIHRRLRRAFEVVLLTGFCGAIGWYGWMWITSGNSFAVWDSVWPWTFSYANLCLAAAAAAVPCWLWPRLAYRDPPHLAGCARQAVNVATQIAPTEIPLRGQARLGSWIPGNEMLHLEIARKTLHLPSLPQALSGLTITHLSDLHFTGDIGRPYFDYVVDQANLLGSDLVIISGDIIESPDCESWIQETLGRLQAPLGKYYVLGNHDKRMPNVAHVRQLLEATGLVNLGGRWLHAELRGCRVLLAGNERPWFAAVPEESLAEEAASPSNAAFRLLVSHSPDQFRWARRHGFDLMLAGHNHGGQVRLPLLGPLISPSLYGTRYSGGVYFEAPTLLHVSRGISGEHPLRWNCLPELAQLTLERG